MSDIVQQGFDYASLPDVTATDLRLTAERIRLRMKRTAEDIIAIGQELIAAKEKAGHGRFGVWLKAEFEMSQDTAARFMNVAGRFDEQIPQFAEYNPSILYLLAAPSTPDSVIEQVTSGAIPATTDAVKEAIREEKSARLRAEIDAQSAQKDREQAQQQLIFLEQTAAIRERKLRESEARIAGLEADKARILAQSQVPVERIVEVEKFVIPPEIAAQLQEKDAAIAREQAERKKLALHAANLEQQLQTDHQLAIYQDDTTRKMRLQWSQEGNKLRRALQEGLVAYPADSQMYAFEQIDRLLLKQIRQVLMAHLEHVERLEHGVNIHIVDAS